MFLQQRINLIGSPKMMINLSRLRPSDGSKFDWDIVSTLIILYS